MHRSRNLTAAVAAMLLCAPAASDAQTAEDVIAKNITAKGGVDTLKSTSTLKITGSMTVQGVDVPMTMWAKRPNLRRNEIEAMGQRMVQGFDGTTAWISVGSMPPQPIQGPQADALKQQAEFDSMLFNYKELGRAVQLVGKETLDGKDVYHIKLTSKDGPVMDYYLDASTGLETKLVTTVEVGGGKQEVETRFEDFQQVEGRTLPFSIRQVVNGTPIAQTRIQKVEFNIPIDDKIFKISGK